MLVGFCVSDYLIRVRAYGPADSHEFCNVESALTKLELRYERLTLPKALSKLDLRDADVLSSLHEQFDHSHVEVGTK